MIQGAPRGGVYIVGRGGRWPPALGKPLADRPSLGRWRPLGETLGRLGLVGLAGLAYGPIPFPFSHFFFTYLLINFLLIFNYFN
jgi:hypothetical protein